MATPAVTPGGAMDGHELDRKRFEREAVEGSGFDTVVEDVAAVRAGDVPAAARVAATAIHVAAVAPERLCEDWDRMCLGWRGHLPRAEAIVVEDVAPGSVPDNFFPALWALVDDPDAGTEAGDITVRTAALAGLLEPPFWERVASMTHRYPGVDDAAAHGLPDRFRFDDIAACPPGSLGGRLHSLVVDEGFDLEVLDRDDLGLSDLQPPLDYVNTRMLQCHDVWHEVAGYETTGLHEIAISAFQMAQFGHQYSSMFLSMVMTKAAFTQPIEGTVLLLDTVLAAWQHGRETPPLLGVEWEEIWDKPMDELRETVGIAPYDSPYDPSLLEILRNGVA